MPPTGSPRRCVHDHPRITEPTEQGSDARRLSCRRRDDDRRDQLLSNHAPAGDRADDGAAARPRGLVFDYGVEDDESTELWGLVSDLDLVAAARGDIDMETARHMSVTPVVTVCSDDSLDRASRLMAEYGVSHLAVLDPITSRPGGVLSTLDVVRVVAA